MKPPLTLTEMPALRPVHVFREFIAYVMPREATDNTWVTEIRLCTASLIVKEPVEELLKHLPGFVPFTEVVGKYAAHINPDLVLGVGAGDGIIATNIAGVKPRTISGTKIEFLGGNILVKENIYTALDRLNAQPISIPSLRLVL